MTTWKSYSNHKTTQRWVINAWCWVLTKICFIGDASSQPPLIPSSGPYTQILSTFKKIFFSEKLVKSHGHLLVRLEGYEILLLEYLVDRQKYLDRFISAIDFSHSQGNNILLLDANVNLIITHSHFKFIHEYVCVCVCVVNILIIGYLWSPNKPKGTGVMFIWWNCKWLLNKSCNRIIFISVTERKGLHVYLNFWYTNNKLEICVPLAG